MTEEEKWTPSDDRARFRALYQPDFIPPMPPRVRLPHRVYIVFSDLDRHAFVERLDAEAWTEVHDEIPNCHCDTCAGLYEAGLRYLDLPTDDEEFPFSAFDFPMD